MKQRESEAEVLGRKLQLQTTELEEARKNCTIKEEVQQLLEQANMDIVRMSSLVFVMNSIFSDDSGSGKLVCVVCSSICSFHAVCAVDTQIF